MWTAGTKAAPGGPGLCTATLWVRASLVLAHCMLDKQAMMICCLRAVLWAHYVAAAT